MNPHFGHVLTGDLRVVRNEELIRLMSKGAKFRECPDSSYDKILTSLFKDIDVYCDKWSFSESRETFAEELEPWKLKVKARIKQRIEVLKESHPNLQSNSVLRRPAVIQELRRIHDRYVVTIVDKASNNFSVQCKKLYFLQDHVKKILDI